MGFPEDFRIVVSDTEAYRQFGNAVAVPVVRSVAVCMVDTLNALERGSDVFSKKKRSEVMSHIRSKDTKIEILVRKWLRSQHIGYRLHARALPGTPDIVLHRYKTVIFVNGCFWHGHGCSLSTKPKANAGSWKSKIEGNRQRDERNHAALAALGWKVIVIWECDLESNPTGVFSALQDSLTTAARPDDR